MDSPGSPARAAPATPTAQYIRVGAGGGTNTIINPPGTVQGVTDQLVGSSPFPILGSEPAFDSSARTDFRPDIPCETQEQPNLASGSLGPAPRQTDNGGPVSILEGNFANTEAGRLSREYAEIYMDYMQAEQMQADGNTTAGRKLMTDVNKRFRIFDRQDFDDYRKALTDLMGGGG